MEQTDLLGISVPSTDPVFLILVVIHILIGLTCVISGMLAMLIQKKSPKHPYFGKIYYWSMISAYISVTILSIMRWPHNVHLLAIGTLAIIFTCVGRWIAQRKRSNWTRLHTICMGASYILLLTGFYVDNGRNLPFWRMFPQWFFWVFPSAIGIPIILYALRKNPLNQANSQGWKL